ncbi:phosphate ABC transporter permease PtsA [Vibrio albus]|uniref:Phosphate transport system permease protein PstA n=1 Tax=Vibrio albus TaxID=2200953 RepID=A0A2U3BF32_9VIBR|nr:phosphate ABC transporter permease PstA [Vibrio albus]PWI35398.1 phosphate ABC transporter permease PtsA [Vibrio albus]
MTDWIKSGRPWIWLTGGAVSISLVAVLGLLLLIGWKGLAYFWPAPLYEWQNMNGKRIVGIVYQKDAIPVEHLFEADSDLPDEVQEQGEVDRLNIKIANRERYPLDFITVLQSELSTPVQPEEWAVIERVRGGDFFGKPVAYETESGLYHSDVAMHLRHGIDFATTIRDEIDRISESEIRQQGWELSQLLMEKQKREYNHQLNDAYLDTFFRKKTALNELIAESEAKLDVLRERLQTEAVIVEDMTGGKTRLSLGVILDAWYPNNMSFSQKLFHWAGKVKQFLTDDPREANSEGGVFPAIFGTVFLVMVMSVIVMPLGVVAAVYLHEYAKNGAFTRLIRIAVINLAGVPSIVYGVFGLGFFVYTLGGTIDELFYSERLPTPTFGTPGLLWSALTLALLTLPVVIVATEEGLSRIPNSVRHGSMALGATQFETLWRIVLPMASPAIITGMILAVARAAGEVAPLMLVGVAKLAPSLPVDGNYPYVHLERKFMHLGYHIYDIGFQSPNIEAARPLVYATSFLLVTVIVGLNLTAIKIRNNLREKYRILEQE